MSLLAAGWQWAFEGPFWLKPFYHFYGMTSGFWKQRPSPLHPPPWRLTTSSCCSHTRLPHPTCSMTAKCKANSTKPLSLFPQLGLWLQLRQAALTLFLTLSTAQIIGVTFHFSLHRKKKLGRKDCSSSMCLWPRVKGQLGFMVHGLTPFPAWTRATFPCSITLLKMRHDGRKEKTCFLLIYAVR